MATSPLRQQLHIGPLAAPTARTYEGGVEQAFLSERIIFRASYFHNEFGKQIEYVGGTLLPELIPNLTPAQQQELIDALGFYYTERLRAHRQHRGLSRAGHRSLPSKAASGANIFLRGGYTYLDAVVQRSFDSDNEALAGGYAPTYNGIPIGAISPLAGARPFRRPPHTGFFTRHLRHRPRLQFLFNAAFASRSDDSTYLEYADANGGNSLLLAQPQSRLRIRQARSWRQLPTALVAGRLRPG